MIHQRRVYIPSAEILTLNSVPKLVELYAGGKPTACVFGAWFAYRFGSTPYTMAGNINLYCETDIGGVPLLGLVDRPQTIDLSLSSNIQAFVPGWVPYTTPLTFGFGFSGLNIGKYLYLYADGGDPSGGDGDLYMWVFWAEMGVTDLEVP
jgi:hypothetical protein